MNRNDQMVLRKTHIKSSSHPFAKVWEMRCWQCGAVYGSNSCDAHIRRCPECQQGRPGEPLEATR